MDANTLKKKLQKQNPLMMSPMAFALAACGGGGGEEEEANSSIEKVSAAGLLISSREIEQNNTMETANIITNNTFKGAVANAQDLDFYFVDAPVDRVVNFVFDGSSSYDDSHVTILNPYGYIMSSRAIMYDATVSAKVVYEGGVWLVIESLTDQTDYEVDIYYSDELREREPNDTVNNADAILAGETIQGQSWSSKDVDYFKFTAESNEYEIYFDGSSSYDDSTVTVLNSQLQVVAEKDIMYSSSIGVGTISGETYYISVSSLTDQTTYELTLNNVGSGVVVPSVLFTEQDSPETPDDYDWAILDASAGKFSLHIENFAPYEGVFNNIQSDVGVVKFVIAYGNISTEDPNYVSNGYSEYNWIDADKAQAIGDGTQKQIIITDDTIKNMVLDTDYDYVSFGVSTTHVTGIPGSFLSDTIVSWALDDFAISEGVIA